MIRDLGDWQGKVNDMLFFGDMAIVIYSQLALLN